jgi:cell pole-organizing protein PopZ
MSQTAKANEPSMEEILASIRRIIADDEPAKAPAAKAPPAAPPPPAPEPAAEEAPKSQDDIDALLAGFDAMDEEPEPAPPPPPPPPAPPKAAVPEPDIFELSKADAVPERMGIIKPISQRADLDFVDAPPPPERYAPPPPPAPPAAVSPLLSAEAHAAVGAAFGSLANSMLVGNRTIEDLLRDMLRPMLKTWLDDNLPQLVERLVRAEIERVSRGPGR